MQSSSKYNSNVKQLQPPPQPRTKQHFPLSDTLDHNTHVSDAIPAQTDVNTKPTTSSVKAAEWKQLQQRKQVDTGLFDRLLNWKRREARGTASQQRVATPADDIVSRRRDETGRIRNSDTGRDQPSNAQHVQTDGSRRNLDEGDKGSSTIRRAGNSRGRTVQESRQVKQDVLKQNYFEEEKNESEGSVESKQRIGNSVNGRTDKLHPTASQKARDRANARPAFDDLGDAEDDTKPDYSSALGRQPRGRGVGRRIVEENDDDEFLYCRDLALAKQSHRGGMRSDMFTNESDETDTDDGEGSVEDTQSSTDDEQQNLERDSDSDDDKGSEGSGTRWERRNPRHITSRSTGTKLWRPGEPKPEARFGSDYPRLATSSKSLYQPGKPTSTVERANQAVNQYPSRGILEQKPATSAQSPRTNGNGAGMESKSGRTRFGGGSASEENLLNENSRSSNVSRVSGKKLYDPREQSKSQQRPKEEYNTEPKGNGSLIDTESQSVAARREVAALERVAAFQKPPVDSIRVPNSPIRARGRGMPGTVTVAEDLPEEHGIDWWVEKIRVKERLAQEYLKLLRVDSSAASATLEMNGIKLDLESRCWKFAYYDLIEEFRGYLTTSRFGQLASTVHTLFMTFLEFASVYYKDFAKALNTIETKVNRTSVGLPRWHRCIGVQGDLARYKALYREWNGGGGMKDTSLWEETKGWYSLGLKLGPGNGKLYNQLAIMASGDDLESLYYYCRSQTVRQPFHTARESIQSLFEKNRLKLARQPAPFMDRAVKLPGKKKGQKSNVLLPTTISWNVFESLFVRLHGIMFTKIGLDNIDTLLLPFLSARPNNMESPLPDFALFFYFQAAMINLSALHGYGPGHVLSSVTTPSEEAKSWLPHFCTLPNMQNENDSVQCTIAPRLTFGMMKHAMDTYVREGREVLSEENRSTMEGFVVYVQVVLMWMVGSGVLSAFGEVKDGSVWEQRYSYVETLSLGFWHSLASFLSRMAEQTSEETIQEVVSFVAERELPVPTDLTSKRPGVQLSSPPTPEDWAIRGTAFFSSTHGSRSFEEFVTMARYYGTALPPDEVSPVRSEDGLWTREEEEDARVHRRRRAVELGLWIAKYVKGFEYDPSSHAFTAASNLEVTRTRFGNVEVESSANEPISESEDGKQTEEHDDDDDKDEEDSSDDEDVRALRDLKARRKQLKDLLASTRERTPSPKFKKSPKRISSVSSTPKLVEGQSVLVIDTNCFVGDLSVVRKIMEGGRFAVVVPLVVITELDGLTRNPQLGEAASEALGFLDQFIKSGPKRVSNRSLRILTSKGNAVPGIGFSEEFSLARDDDDEDEDEEEEEEEEEEDGKSRRKKNKTKKKTAQKKKKKKKTDSKARNLDDLILATCLTLGTSGSSPGQSVEEPVLVTGDANLRLKARARDVRTLDGGRLARDGKKEGWW